MRDYLFSAVVAAFGLCGFFAVLPSCKTVQSVRCISTSYKPVVVIGTNGLPYTIMVPFCDTLKVIPKMPDSLRLQ
jgi:hypothetical protein